MIIDARLGEATLLDLRRRLSPEAAALAVGSRPGVRFAVRRAESATAPGASRHGGHPDLPPGTAWPTWFDSAARASRPLSFHAQLDLAPIAGASGLPLPEGGLLLFFCDYDNDGEGVGSDGMDGYGKQAARVLHVPNGDLVRTPAPPGARVFRERELLPILVTTFAQGEPSEARDEFGEHLAARLRDLVPDAWSTTGLHQLGGHAFALQNDVELATVWEAAGIHFDRDGDLDRAAAIEHQAADWRLLFQLDTDTELDLCWGDHGLLCWVTHLGTLTGGELSETWIRCDML